MPCRVFGDFAVFSLHDFLPLPLADCFFLSLVNFLVSGPLQAQCLDCVLCPCVG